MAVSKAQQVKKWQEEVSNSEVKYLKEPTWFKKVDRSVRIKIRKPNDDQQGLSRYGNFDVSLTLCPTSHAELRMAQRNLSAEEIGYVLLYGQSWHKAGAVITHLRKKDIPSIDCIGQRRQRLIGATVVTTTYREGLILTAYRNLHSGLRKIKSKPDYGWSHNATNARNFGVKSN